MKIKVDIARSFYENVDPARRQERADGRMVWEDPKATANLYQQPIYHTFNPDKYCPKFSMFDQDDKFKG